MKKTLLHSSNFNTIYSSVKFFKKNKIKLTLLKPSNWSTQNIQTYFYSDKILLTHSSPVVFKTSGSLLNSLDFSLKMYNFRKFEDSVSQLFLNTRIDKHRRCYNAIRMLVKNDFNKYPNLVGLKFIIKGKLSASGNSRKRKITLTIPTRYPKNHLWKSLKYSCFTESYEFLVPTRTGVSSVSCIFKYTR